MSENSTIVFLDYLGRPIRLTQERWMHLLDHPELAGQLARIQETLSQPEIIVGTTADPAVVVYHQYYHATPVTTKYLLVVQAYSGRCVYIDSIFQQPSKERAGGMAEVKIWYDQEGDMLEVIFEDTSAYLEELDEDVFERRTPQGRIVGFTVLNFSKHDRDKLTLPLAVTASESQQR